MDQVNPSKLWQARAKMYEQAAKIVLSEAVPPGVDLQACAADGDRGAAKLLLVFADDLETEPVFADDDDNEYRELRTLLHDEHRRDAERIRALVRDVDLSLIA